MIGDAVCDSSAVVALLLDSGSDGQWAADTLAGARLLAPNLVIFESSNIIRRHEMAGLVSADQAAQAHVDLLDHSSNGPTSSLAGACGSCAQTSRATTPAMLP